jgi:hypothetical protein
VTLIDTAHAYATVEEEAHNERLVARALATEFSQAPMRR